MSSVRSAAGLFIFRVINNRVEYLLLQARERDWNWGNPKGHVEEGESEIETAKRETKEETGIKDIQYEIYSDFHSILEYTAWGKPKRVIYWPAKVFNPDIPIILSEEHSDFCWKNLSDSLSLINRENMNKALNDCEIFLKKKLNLS